VKTENAQHDGETVPAFAASNLREAGYDVAAAEVTVAQEAGDQ
jgi:hypothetical protein